MRVRALLVAGALLLAGCANPFNGPSPQRFEAVFARSNNLFVGSEVKVLGIRVGRVTALEAHGADVLAILEVDPDLAVPADVRARIKPLSLLGERFVQLEPAYTSGARLAPGAQIPLERTGVPAEVDEVLASFEQFLSALDDEALAQLVSVLSETLEGQGAELNTLLDRASVTLTVLSDASDDLVAVAANLGELNETVATRDERIGAVIEDWSTVVRTIARESDQIIEGVGNLRRLTVALRSITEDHSDPLVGDLEVLATTTATVQRNLDNLGLMILGAADLFEGAGRGVEYEDARIKLNNQAQPLAEAIVLRLQDRLVGVCLRLGVPDCQTPAFWQPIVPALVCIEGYVPCVDDRASVAEAISAALGHLPPEALDQLATEAAARMAAQEDDAAAGAQATGPGPADDEAVPPDDDGLSWRDRLARILSPSSQRGGDS